jgi:hypothetical protein
MRTEFRGPHSCAAARFDDRRDKAISTRRKEVRVEKLLGRLGIETTPSSLRSISTHPACDREMHRRLATR